MFVFACLVTRSVLRELNPKKKKNVLCRKVVVK